MRYWGLCMSGFRKYDNLPGPGINGQEKAALTAGSYVILDAAEMHAPRDGHQDGGAVSEFSG